jgi:hypothetical protein
MEETVILHFEVDQAGAEQKLEKIEGLILDNRKAQQELTKAYKAGTITQEEYVKENLRLQQNIKKEQDQKRTLLRTINTESNSRDALKLKVSQLTKEYDSLNLKTAQGAKRADELEKELAQLNAQLTKGDKAAGLFKNQIGNYPAQFKDAASQIRVAGVSVGDLTGRLASFANPATAAIGIVTALGAAYANSSRGAKDLEFAQTQVSFALKQLSNDFANLFSSAEDGEGILTKYVNTYLKIGYYTPIGQALRAFGIDLKDVAEQSKELALIVEQLQDLGREETRIRGENSDRLEQNQELLELIADDQQKITDRINAANEAEKNLQHNKIRTLYILNQQLLKLKELEEADPDSESALDARIDKEAQIRRESAALEKQITKINKQQADLNAKLAEELDKRRKIAAAEQELFGFEVREANAPNISLAQESVDTSSLSDPIIQQSKDRQNQFIEELKTVDFTEKQKQEHYIQTAQLQATLAKEDRLRRLAEAEAILNLAGTVSGSLSQLAKEGSEEQKALALTGIAFDTASALAGGIAASQDIPYPGNLAAMASTVAAIIAAIAEAEAVISGYADGGWTGPGGKYDVAGVVHADEYVVPKSVNNMPQAQPYLAALERMRGGYADGGFVTNTTIAPVQQSLIISNALKNMPIPVVSVREVTQVQNRIIVRETVSTL